MGTAAQREAGMATVVPNTVRILTQTPRQTGELPGAAVQMLERSRQVTIIILAVCSVRQASDPLSATSPFLYTLLLL